MTGPVHRKLALKKMRGVKLLLLHSQKDIEQEDVVWWYIALNPFAELCKRGIINFNREFFLRMLKISQLQIKKIKGKKKHSSFTRTISELSN